MPGCIENSLHKLQHSSSLYQHNITHQCRRPQYSARIQYALDDDTNSEIYKDDKTKVQHIVGTLLDYAWAVECTMLAALNTITE